MTEISTTARRIARAHNKACGQALSGGVLAFWPDGTGGGWYSAGSQLGPAVLAYPVQHRRVTYQEVQDWLDGQEADTGPLTEDQELALRDMALYYSAEYASDADLHAVLRKGLVRAYPGRVELTDAGKEYLKGMTWLDEYSRAALRSQYRIWVDPDPHDARTAELRGA